MICINNCIVDVYYTFIKEYKEIHYNMECTYVVIMFMYSACSSHCYSGQIFLLLHIHYYTARRSIHYALYCIINTEMAVHMSIPPVAVAVGANVLIPGSVGGYNNSNI